MKNYIHILNGDSLRERFPESIDGELIVARECLIDGPVQSVSLEDLYQKRAQFLSEGYEKVSKEDYHEKTVKEFEKIQNILEGSLIYLWFEDDLFCQVNFWFVVHILHTSNKNHKVYLVRPEDSLMYGFGGHSGKQLVQAYEKAHQLEEIQQIANLWDFYQNGDLEKLEQVGELLREKYPFITIAINAHMERIPNEKSEGRPIESLRAIMQELNTNEFLPVFKEFNKREAIYGFGDLQVKRLMNQINN